VVHAIVEKIGLLAVAKMKIDLVAVAKLVLLYKLAVARFI
jgi:hypothetical protein